MGRLQAWLESLSGPFPKAAAQLLGLALLGANWIPFAHAQRLPSASLSAVAQEAESQAERVWIRRARFARELARARAHAALGAASSGVAGSPYCPATGPASMRSGSRSPSKALTSPLVARYAPPGRRWQGVAAEAESAPGIFGEYLSGRVVQAKCVHCHVAGGLSGHTRLVFARSESAGHEAQNLQMFEAFVSTVEDGPDRILNKIRGIGHGGGVQVPAGSPEFANMERFLRLLARSGPSPGGSPETLFEGVTMAAPARTLRRAALIFAGRVPTATEIASVRDGRPASLRAAIRNLMQGQGFHDFLIRAANDRLLTDRHLSFVLDFHVETDLADLANLNWQMAKQAIERGHQSAEDDPIYVSWAEAMQYGIARSPLELIAYVVENDRPYTEILTGDYVMANPIAAKGYGASTRFRDPSSASEFQPSRIVNYFRTDNSKVTEFHRQYGTRVVNAGNLETAYPHAGILNTRAFLRRYPTTETNRNRARSRWTYYHFLGVDLEKAASRMVDLSMTENPTLNSPACAACHAVMDPVAGTFQNYSEDGGYKISFGGLDSLPDLYKFPPDGAVSPYRQGDTWYRDMREPGFGGERAPDPDNSLQWLAQRIAADKRFAEAAVKFWWPAILGAEIADYPEDRTGPDFAGSLAAWSAQTAEVARLADAFQSGTAGSSPYSAKDLFVEIALSPWFRAESVAGSDPVRRVALSQVGAERLLTPEELARKTDSITGYRWGRSLSNFIHEVDHLDGEGDDQGGAYELLYGGIDSKGILNRTRSLTPLMAAVAQNHAIRSSCAIVQREFFMWPEGQRRLFGGISADTVPDPAAPSGSTRIRRKLVELHWKLFGVTVSLHSPDVEAAYQLFVDVWERKRRTEGSDFYDGQTECPVEDTAYFDGIIADAVAIDEQGNSSIDWDRVESSWNFQMEDPHHAVRTWVVVLAYLMADYRYLHL